MTTTKSASSSQQQHRLNLQHNTKTPFPFALKALSYALLLNIALPQAYASDRNAPLEVNSLFSDTSASAADLYDLYGFPGTSQSNETLVVALTFAPLPASGVFDQSVMYRIFLDPDPRMNSDELSFWDYTEAYRKKFLEQDAGEVRVTFNDTDQVKLSFTGFAEKDFAMVIPINQTSQFETPQGNTIKAFAGGRDDPYFADQVGLMRAMNYGPQFYQIPHDSEEELQEFPIPKTLIELDGNSYFNTDPAQPLWGISEKRDAPDISKLEELEIEAYMKDADGDYRSVFTGTDAYAGLNVNSIILEIPLALITTTPQEDRIIRTWSESWQVKKSKRSDSRYNGNGKFNENIEQFEQIDTEGAAFFDSILNVRDEDQQDTYNLSASTYYVRRFAHLGWGFGPSLNALGLKSCFDSGDASVSQWETYSWTMPAFNLSQRCLFQEINMADDSWNKNNKNLEPPRAFQAFTPSLISIDMDTTGTWPFGRRLEDQIASRFLALFLDMETGCKGTKCNIDSLNDQALWANAPVKPKTPPHPLSNDKAFLSEFPYLAEPWSNQ